MVPEMGSGHRAGGADLASGVDTAGTVARIDLRLPHHPVCEVASADSDASARITLRLAPTRPLRRHVSRPAPPALFIPPTRPPLSASSLELHYQLFAGRLGVTHARLVV